MDGIQLDLFNNTELDQMKSEIKLALHRTDNVRKGLFARHNEIVRGQQDLFKMIESLQKEITYLKILVEEKHESDIIQLTQKVMWENNHEKDVYSREQLLFN